MTSPKPGAYNNGATSVTTTPTLIATVESDSGGVLVQNVTGTAITVYLGGVNVASTGANQGFSLAQNASVTVPSVGSVPNQLYAVAASGTATVVVLFPSGS